MCILSVGLYIYSCTLIKVVRNYDLSVLSMSVKGFKKQIWMGGGWVGGVSSMQKKLGFFEFFLTLQSPLPLPNITQCRKSWTICHKLEAVTSGLNPQTIHKYQVYSIRIATVQTYTRCCSHKSSWAPICTHISLFT